MTLTNAKLWKTTVVGMGMTFVVGAGGCATTGASTPMLAAAQGGEATDQVCEGIPTKERELGLLSYRDAFGGTAPLSERVQVSKGLNVDQETGVRIAIRAQPGLTAPWLARVASCHMALAAAGRIENSAGKGDPLLVPGAQVSVNEAYTGFVVSVRAPNVDASADMARRAEAMLAAPTGPATAQAE
jgi:hypothetical protein